MTGILTEGAFVYGNVDVTMNDMHWKEENGDAQQTKKSEHMIGWEGRQREEEIRSLFSRKSDRLKRMGFSDEARCLEPKTECDCTDDSQDKEYAKASAAGRSKASKSGNKRERSRMTDELEEDHLCQERAYEREKMRDEELLSYKDWHRRIKAAQLRENARRRKTKREQDEQKAMEAARCFAEPIRRKAPLPKKLVSL